MWTKLFARARVHRLNEIRANFTEKLLDQKRRYSYNKIASKLFLSDLKLTKRPFAGHI